ncbi:MAG: two-component regulator propeller domain-containing protein, partial [Bacteroidota bacterium]
ELPNGQLWAGGHDGLFQLIEKEGLQFIRHQHQSDQPNSLSYNLIEDIQVDGNGKFWIGTYKGGLNEVLLPETPGDSLQFIHHRSNPSVPSSISSDRVRAVLKDRSGTLWVGTYSGLDKMNPSNRKFEAVAPIPNDPTSLSNKNVRSFATDQKGNLWISTFGGLNFLSAKNLEARNYQFQVFGPDPDNPVSMTNAQGGQLMLDSRNYLWMATFFGHHFIDLETFLDEPTFRWIGTNRNLPHTYTTCTYEIDSVTHWIGTVNGLAKMRYNPKTRKPPPYLKVFHKAPEQPDSLYSDLITEIAKDRFGYFWIATSEGLCRYIPDDGHGRFERYQNNPHDPKSLSSNTIGTFHFDSQKRLWMGTANGLNLLLQESADSPIRFRHFDQSDGLPSENILSIEEDQRGHFWLGTHQGLIHFDPEAALAGKDGLQRFYNHQNGLSESYLLNSHKDANGRMYFSTGNGFIHFDPEQLIQNHHIPPVVLTELKISRKAIHPSNADGSLLPRAIGFTKQLTLQHHQNDIELAFAALDFANATANRYQYQLLGLDDDWVDNGYYNTATYTNLSPGHYTFRVKGSNNDGYWNEEPTELKIYILPPWWLSWWAYLLYLLLFSSIVYAFIRFRVKQRIAALEKQAEIEAVRYEEREQLRKKNAADFHDDLGHRLTKANLFLELATREADTDTRLATLLTKIKTNINGLSEGMRDLIWSLDPQKDTLHQTLARLQEFGDNMFEFSPIEFKTEGIVQQLEKTELAPDVRKHILMIFKEAMNNTLKYSEADKAVLRTQPHNNHWSIVFQDDGKGFQTKATSQGYGLKNMRKRAKTIGAQIEIQSDGQTGTAVVLHLNPKTKRHG